MRIGQIEKPVTIVSVFTRVVEIIKIKRMMCAVLLDNIFGGDLREIGEVDQNTL